MLHSRCQLIPIQKEKEEDEGEEEVEESLPLPNTGALAACIDAAVGTVGLWDIRC